jgi:glycosyltransferase involved in cell wall biosynthesis
MADRAEIWLLDDAAIMGGGQMFALRLARHVRSSTPSLDVRVACPPDSDLGRACREAGVPVDAASFPDLFDLRLPRQASAIARTRELLRAASPATILVGNSPRAQAYMAAAWLTLRRPQLRIVNLMHERDSARRRTAPFVYRRVGSLVAVGENVARAYRERLPGVAVRVINIFLGEDELDAAVAARRPPPSGPRPVLGLLGRLIPEKGVIELVDELATMPESWESLGIGAPAEDQAYAREVQASVERAGLAERVRLLGRVDDVGAFLAGIDILVVPSVGNEGQPFVVLEALAHGRPGVVRRPALSPEYAELPVRSYDGARDLAKALDGAPREPVSADELRRRFGPEQAVDGLVRAAKAA